MKTLRVPVLVFCISFIVLVASLGDYGITWDEPENFFTGRVYLNVFSHLSTTYLRNPNRLAIPDPVGFRQETHWERYPPFAVTLASLSSYVFSQRLHILHPVIAHHVVVVLFGSLGILGTYALSTLVGGSGITAAIVLFLILVYFGQSHNNIKDIPGAAMYIAALCMWLFAIQKKNRWWFVVAGVMTGFSIATKISAFFVLPTVLVWMILSKISLRWFWVGTIVCYVSLCTAWPWLLVDFPQHFLLVWRYTQEVGRGLSVLFYGALYHAG
jgi:4-amino-4-deoxy-L-arabinose transferase-like glycosyltransferase